MGGRKEWCGYGTSFTAPRWLTLDVCGLLGVSCSAGIHVLAAIVLVFDVVLFSSENPSDTFAVLLSSLVFYVLYGPATVLALVSLWRATTTDPGAVPMGARPFTRVTQLPRSNSSASTSATSASTVGGALWTETIPDDALRHPAMDTIQSPTTPLHGPTSSTTPPISTSTTPISTLPPSVRSIRRCPKCNDNYKPPRAHHDSVTGRCIVKFDHYCPWINNAVGALNHKLFCLFLLYTALTCSMVWVLVGVRLWHCSHSDGTTANSSAASSRHDIWNGATSPNEDGTLRLLASTPGATASPHDFIRHFPAALFPEQCQALVSNVLVRSLCLASVIFFVFTTVMGCEQIEAIRSGKGKIARLQQSVGAAGTEVSRVTTEFNEMFGGTSPHVAWHWFVPVPVRFVPRGMKYVVLGYEFNDTCRPVPYDSDTECDVETGTFVNGTRDSVASLDPLPDAYPAHGLPFTSALLRETSDGNGSVKNRRQHQYQMSPEDEGITLVERTKTRLS